LKVSGLTFDVFLNQELLKHQNNPEATALSIPDKIAEAQACKASMEAWSQSATQWKSPLNFRKEFEDLKALLKKWKASVRELNNMRDSLERLVVDAKQDVAVEKRNWHENRKKIDVWLARSTVGVPANVCSALANVIYALAKDPITVGLEHSYVVRELSYTDGDERQALFSEARKLSAVQPDAALSITTTNWHLAVANFVKLNLNDCATRKQRQDRTIEQENLGHCLGTLELAA